MDAELTFRTIHVVPRLSTFIGPESDSNHLLGADSGSRLTRWPRSCMSCGPKRAARLDLHSSQLKETPESRNEHSIREFSFPVHSQIAPCSGSCRKRSFLSQGIVRCTLIIDWLVRNAQ